MADKLNAQRTTESLMLLKGTHEKLADLEITPGAIYFTTDYPGIYVDFGAEGEKDEPGYKSERRVRMGDVTVVETLAELKDLAYETISKGQKLGANTLYYAKDKNVLCIYDEDEEEEGKGKFVWINDISTLDAALTTLTGDVNTLTTNLGTLTDLVGSSGDDKDDETVFGAIAAETARAEKAEQGLQDQIDAITGEDGGSISDLQEQINAINDALTGTEGEGGGLVGRITNLETTVNGTSGDGHEGRLDTIEDKLTGIEAGAQVNIIAAIDVKIDGVSDPYVNISSSDKKATITLPKDLSKYDSKNVINGIRQDIDEIKGDGWDGTQTIKGNADAISNLQTDLSDIEVEVKEYTDNTAERVRADLAKEINDKLAAADAMTFKDTVGFKDSDMSQLDLPTTGVQAGDTYVVEEGLDSTDTNNTYHAGDMMIAKYDQPTAMFNPYFVESELVNQDRVQEQCYLLDQPELIQIYYTEWIDAGNQAYLGDGLVAGRDERGRTVTGYGYLRDNIQQLRPVLYTNSNVRPQNPAEQWPMDYEVPLYYVGRQTINGVPYDKWRTIERFNDDTQMYTWNNPAQKYTYTNVITKDESEYPLEWWAHVKTGYDGVHEAKLSAEAIRDDDDDKEVGATVALTSHVGTNLGVIQLPNSPNIALTTTGSNDIFEINMQLVWSTF